MRRRTYLARAASIGAVAIAPGCTERALEDAERKPPLFEGLYEESAVDLPVEQEFDVVADGVELAQDAAFGSAAEFEDFLDESDVGPERLVIAEADAETVVELEIAPDPTAGEGNAHSVGVVAGGFAAFVRGGFDGSGLDASVLDDDRRQYGAFEIETGWAEAFLDGGKSAAEYGSDALKTLETKREATD